MNFRKLLQDIQEETVASDIASIESKIGSTPLRHQGKNGKKCKKHKRVDCQECQKN